MYRKNTAGQFVSFAAVNATNGAALTGATISMRRCLDGTFAAGGATITEDTGLGFYKVALAQADTNGNNCQFFFTATNMVPVCINIVTTAADPTDSVRFGLTALPNATAGANTGLPVVGTQVPNATAGASGGLLISGSNSGTTTFGAVTCTGTLTVSDGIVVTRSTGNSDGVSITGSGTGNGLKVRSGNGVTGNGLDIASAATSGNGAVIAGTGISGIGVNITSVTGDALVAKSTGGGRGMYVRADQYRALELSSPLAAAAPALYISGGNLGAYIASSAGHGLHIAATGTNSHGLYITGGTAGTCDGINATAGAGGVDIRGNITGNLTGSVSGAVGSVTGAVASVTGNVGGNVVGSVASVTGNVGGNVVGSVGSVTGNVGGNVVGTVASVASVTNIVSGGAITTSGGAVSTVTTVTDLTSTTRAEPGQGAPGATLSPAAKLDYLYKAWRNRTTQDASTYKLYADDATTVDQKASVSDSGSVFDRGEIATGP